jgi:hypothetical protein
VTGAVFRIVLRSEIDGQITSVWRSRQGWRLTHPTTYGTRAEAEKELDFLRQSQAANIHRMFVELVTR